MFFFVSQVPQIINVRFLNQLISSLVLILYDRSSRVLNEVLFLFCLSLRDFKKKGYLIFKKMGEFRVQ